MDTPSVAFVTTPDGLTDQAFEGFFENWPNSPSASQLRAILSRSHAAVIAMDEQNNAVGFINAISDGELFAFVPLLEVKPRFRNRGIGSQLVKRLLAALDGIYAVDLSCDADLVPFYEALGFRSAGNAMIIRNYESQSGLSRRA